MLEQLRKQSKSLVKFWIWTTLLGIFSLIGTIIFFVAFTLKGQLTSLAENPTAIVAVVVGFLIVILGVYISEIVKTVKCIKKCNEIIRLNPPIELKEKIANQKKRLQWLILAHIIYLVLGTQPYISSIVFIGSIYLKYKFWSEIDNIA